MKSFKEFLQEQFGELNESSLSRIWGKTQKHTCGAISGFRNENSKEQNLKNNKEIQAYLQSKGYSVTRVAGSYIEDFDTETAKEVSEPSFFVCNQNVEGDDNGQLEADLKKLGKKYDQDSILIVPHGGEAYLLGTSSRSNAYPGMGITVKVGKAKFGAAAGPFFSRIKNRQFAFEEVEEPTTRNGKWAQYLMSR